MNRTPWRATKGAKKSYENTIKVCTTVWFSDSYNHLLHLRIEAAKNQPLL